MNINRNVLIVAGALLVATLPAGAQVLGGGVGGAMNGALGGGIGQGIHGNGGFMGGGSIDSPDVAGKAGKVRERATQAGERTRETAANTAGAARSQVQKARGSASASGAVASSATAQDGSLLFGASSAAGAQKQVLGRDVAAAGNATSNGGADRTGFSNSTAGDAGVSVKKTETATTEAPPAQ